MGQIKREDPDRLRDPEYAVEYLKRIVHDDMKYGRGYNGIPTAFPGALLDVAEAHGFVLVERE